MPFAVLTCLEQFRRGLIPIVVTKNSESAEESRVSRFTAVMSPACSSSCVSSFLYSPAGSASPSGSGTRGSRPAPSAKRSSSAATRSSAAFADRPFALGMALPIMAALPRPDGAAQAGHRCPMAPSVLPLVLAMAFEIRAAFVAIPRVGGLHHRYERLAA